MSTASRSSSKSLADQAVEILPAEVGERLDDVRDGAEELDHRIRQTVAQHPLMCVSAALLAGYFVGRLIARR